MAANANQLCVALVCVLRPHDRTRHSRQSGSAPPPPATMAPVDLFADEWDDEALAEIDALEASAVAGSSQVMSQGMPQAGAMASSSQGMSQGTIVD